MDNRDPADVFGVLAAGAVIKSIQPLAPRERYAALQLELDNIDPVIFKHLKANVSKMLFAEAGLGDLTAIQEALAPIFADHIRSALSKFRAGDRSALSGYTCHQYEPTGNIFGDVFSGIKSAVTSVANSSLLQQVRCNPIGDAFAGAYGFGAIHAKACGGDSAAAAQELLLAQQAVEAQRRADEQRKLLLYGGLGLGAILLVVVIT